MKKYKYVDFFRETVQELSMDGEGGGTVHNLWV